MTAKPRREVFSVAPEAEGERLDQWLVSQMPDFSRSALQRLIREGRVTVNGRVRTKPGHGLRAGETIEVTVPPPTPVEPIAQAISLDIVHEDDDLLVLNKPAGMVVHPAAGNRQGTLVNALLHHCRGLSSIGGVERPGIIHRLDKRTSGLMVVAKNDAAHRHLTAQLADRTMKRIYAAVVWGEPQPPEGTIDAPVGRNPRDRKRMAVVEKGGRRAVTHYRTLRTTGALSVLELSLETGRTHQVRVHLAHLGCPVVGDEQYGFRGKKAIRRSAGLLDALRSAVAQTSRQLLHAHRLRLIHPTSGETLVFESSLPEDIARVLAAMAMV